MDLIEIGKLEPRIWDLIRDADLTNTRESSQWGYCPLRCFYVRFKGRVMELVGWERCWDNNFHSEQEKILHSSRAYDAVYEYVLSIFVRDYAAR